MASCLGPGGAPLTLPPLAAPAGDAVDPASLSLLVKAAVLAQAELDKRKKREEEEAAGGKERGEEGGQVGIGDGEGGGEATGGGDGAAAAGR